MITDITPTETDGQHWIVVSMGGHETSRYGPYSNADAAEATVARLAGICRSLFHQLVQASPKTRQRGP